MRQRSPTEPLADPHIHRAVQHARKRLPTKLPESEAFRAEVRGWMKRALSEGLDAALAQGGRGK